MNDKMYGILMFKDLFATDYAYCADEIGMSIELNNL